jgi:hypothetical protein
LAQKKKIGGSEIIQVSNAISQRNIDLIDDQIGLLFNILCSSYEKRIIFIDNLDKAAPELFGLVRDYFRLQQSFYEQFTNELDTYVFISLQPFIGARFRTDKEVNFLAGKIIKVKPWTEFELDDLLRKRLQKVYTGNFNLDEFFTRPARRLIYTNNEYNPRWSLLAVKRLLKRAYEIFRSKQNQEKRYAIDDYFCRRYYEDMDGVKKGLDISRINFDTLHAQVRNSFKHVYDKIGNVIEIYDDYRYEIVETMVSIYKNEEYLEDQASLNKLENAGLIQTLHGRYNLSQDIIKLFKFIDENVNGNSSYFKYYLLQFLT